MQPLDHDRPARDKRREARGAARPPSRADDRRERLERALALARLTLALLAALMLSLEPAARLAGIHGVSAVAMSYTLYAWAAAVVVAVVTTAALGRLAVVLQCLDLAWVLFIALAYEARSEAFFLFFVFVLVGAAYRWGLRQTVVTGLVTAAVLLAARGLAGDMLVRAVYAVGLSLLVGYLAEEQHRARAQAAASARVLAAITAGGGLRQSVHGTLRELAEAFAASRVVMQFEETDAHRAYEWEHPRTDAGVPRERTPDERSHIVTNGPSNGRVYRLRRRRSAIERADDDQWRLVKREAADAPLADALLGDAPSVIVGETPIGGAWAGRLVLVAPRAFTDESSRRWLATLLPQVGLGLYSVYLLGRLRSRVTAMERSRLARELHDGLIQSLVALEMHVEVLRRRLDAGHPPAPEELIGVQQKLRTEVLNVRDLMQQIRPIQVDARDLPGRLAELTERFRRDTTIDARFVCEPGDVPLAPRQAREIVRIVQEALVNIRKHSGATTVIVRFAATTDGWTITMDDDGHGFDFEGRHSLEDLDAARRGPLVIKERVRLLGGRMVLDSAPGRGTRLEISVPSVPE